MTEALLPRITRTAIEAYRVDHPEAELADLHAALLAGRRESAEVVAAVLRHRGWAGTTYTSTVDFSGLFVVRDETVVTYIRLLPTQQRILCEPVPSTPGKKSRQARVIASYEEQRLLALAKRYASAVPPVSSEAGEDDATRCHDLS